MKNWLRKAFFTIKYWGNPPWDTQITPPEVVEFCRTHPPSTALDLGCGTGTNVIYLAQQGWMAKGVDFVPSAIRAARRKAQQAGVKAEFVVGDVSNPHQYGQSFGLVLDIGCFISLSPQDKERYTRRVAEILANEGSFLIYGFCRRDETSRLGMAEQDLQRFKRYFTLIERLDSEPSPGRHAVWLRFQKRKP